VDTIKVVSQMPTPAKLSQAQRQDLLAAQGDFEVHEVFECVSSDEEGFGEEDLQPHEQVRTLQEQLTLQRQQRAAEDEERKAAAAAETARAIASGEGDEAAREGRQGAAQASVASVDAVD
jgi:hypothetical protein